MCCGAGVLENEHGGPAQGDFQRKSEKEGDHPSIQAFSFKDDSQPRESQTLHKFSLHPSNQIHFLFSNHKNHICLLMLIQGQQLHPNIESLYLCW